MVLSPQGFQDACSHNANPISSSVSDTALLSYSTEYYQYNSDRQVTTQLSMGFMPTATPSPRHPPAATMPGKEETVETRPDQNTYTVYTNFLGETLLSDLHDASANTHSYTYNQYGGDNSDAYEAAQLTFAAGPSAISGTPIAESNGTLVVNWNNSYQYDYYSTAADGGAVGYLKDEWFVDGNVQSGPPDWTLLDLYTYSTNTGTYDGVSITIYPVASYTPYGYNGSIGAETTSYSYTWDTADGLPLQAQEVTTTLPAVTDGSNGTVNQNGSGTSATTDDYYNSAGELTWQMDERGYLTYYVYDSVTGLLTESVEDVSTSSLPAALPGGWAAPAAANPNGQNLTTDYQYDVFGRVIGILGPVHTGTDVNGSSVAGIRTATWYAYNDVGTSNSTLYDGSTNVLGNAGVGSSIWSAGGYVVAAVDNCWSGDH